MDGGWWMVDGGWWMVDDAAKNGDCLGVRQGIRRDLWDEWMGVGWILGDCRMANQNAGT